MPRLTLVLCLTVVAAYLTASSASATPTFMGLGDLPGGIFNSLARAVSADGSVVVGRSRSGSGGEAFRWTEDGGMVGLGFLPEGTQSIARGVSADGSVVVGDSLAGTFQAFIWDEINGMRSLRDVLTNDYGLDLTGWTLTSAHGVSADGTTIVGWGTSPSGSEAFLATIPEPSTGLLFGLGLAGLAVVGRRFDATSSTQIRRSDGGDIDVGLRSNRTSVRWTHVHGIRRSLGRTCQ